MRKNIAILSILTTSLMSYAAMAQDEAAPSPEGAPPPEAVHRDPKLRLLQRPLQSLLRARSRACCSTSRLSGRVRSASSHPGGRHVPGHPAIVLNLSKDAVLKPVSIPLDLRFGVTNELEVFVSHTVLGAPMAWGGASAWAEQTEAAPRRTTTSISAAILFR